ncbi:MAG: hypothetical protein U0872_07035 [Planctomycetaceae bacterium]
MRCWCGVIAFLVLTMACPPLGADVIELQPVVVEHDGVFGWNITWRDLAGRSTNSTHAGVELLLPGAKAVPVLFSREGRS